ncbi:MAG: HDOD domain-containing protein [Pseudomonadota bacterium]
MPTAQMLLKEFGRIKTLPRVAIRLTKLISDEKSTMKDFEEVITLDPTLVLRLLKAVNSPYYGLREKVDSISRAVVFVGMKNLRNMILATALGEVFEGGSHEDISSRPQLWLHSAAVSVFSKMIAERIFGRAGEDAFLCGILHNIGMIIEDQVAGDLFIQACRAYKESSMPFIEIERTLIGADHCETGYLLACEWGLSRDVREGIRDHHETQKEFPPSSMTGMIRTAEYLVSKLNYTAMPGMRVMPFSGLSAYLRNNLDEYKALLADLPDEMTKAKEIYETQME